MSPSFGCIDISINNIAVKIAIFLIILIINLPPPPLLSLLCLLILKLFEELFEVNFFALKNIEQK
jgi:hypothetical protein